MIIEGTIYLNSSQHYHRLASRPLIRKQRKTEPLHGPVAESESFYHSPCSQVGLGGVGSKQKHPMKRLTDGRYFAISVRALDRSTAQGKQPTRGLGQEKQINAEWAIERKCRLRFSVYLPSMPGARLLLLRVFRWLMKLDFPLDAGEQANERAGKCVRCRYRHRFEAQKIELLWA